MIEVVSNITGIVIAAGILAGVRKLGELTNAVRDLDLRVSTLEQWLQRPGVREHPGRPNNSRSTPGSGVDC